MRCRSRAAAGAAAAQAHVDDLGRVGVGRDARYGAAGCPHHGVGDVGQVTATLAQHAHRKHLGLEGDTGHADAVVGLLGHGAGDVRAVPGTVLGQRAVVTLVIVFDPVAIVLRTGLPAGCRPGPDAAAGCRCRSPPPRCPRPAKRPTPPVR
ncbi:hypothetical protein G6F63_013901 [Rhizopus arrhizus]|nr:hypothetical protein G6F63_013901 [Rhizopus arrhizus]